MINTRMSARYSSTGPDGTFPNRTTASYPEAIDHHLVTNELVPLYLAGSAEVYRVDQYIPSYSSTTSDHFPTITRYSLGGGGGSAQLVINEILANEPGSSTGGEFVEIVNVGSAAADLGGFTLSDATAVRHTFPAGSSLGAGSAVDFLSKMKKDPDAAANEAFPNAAKSNEGVFYKGDGTARSLKEVYEFFKKKFYTKSFDNESEPKPPEPKKHKPAATEH